MKFGPKFILYIRNTHTPSEVEMLEAFHELNKTL